VILVDSRTGSKELLGIIQRMGVPAQLEQLPFGDFAFEGNGPHGEMLIGIERKTLQDILKCIDSSRLAGRQLVGMRKLYSQRFVLIEGMWRANIQTGLLVEGYNGGSSWGYYKRGGREVMYSKLYRYLLSVELAGTPVIYSHDITHSAYNICEIYHYFQKRWKDHTAMKTMHHEELPSLLGKPSLVRRWAKELEGIGEKLSEDTARVFKTPRALANGEESDFLRVPGVGPKTAISIVKEIRGWKP